MSGGVGGVGLEVAEDELSSSGLMFRNKVELIIHLGLPEILEEVPGLSSSSGLMFRNEVELIIHLGLPEILEEVPGLSSIGGKTRLLMVVQKSSQICQSKSCS